MYIKDHRLECNLVGKIARGVFNEKQNSYRGKCKKRKHRKNRTTFVTIFYCGINYTGLQTEIFNFFKIVLGELYVFRYAEFEKAIHFDPSRKDFPQSGN